MNFIRIVLSIITGALLIYDFFDERVYLTPVVYFFLGLIFLTFAASDSAREDFAAGITLISIFLMIVSIIVFFA